MGQKRKAVDNGWLPAPLPPSGGFPADVVVLPPQKRARGKGKGKAVAADDSGEEKRLARFKSACPKAITERVERVMTQRFFMINRARESNALREEFKVLGSTGNVYTVIVDRLPSCNCPDASKGNHCKHILFVFLKVLSVSQYSNLYYQKALLGSELESIFANAPVAPNSVTNPRIKAAYAKASGSSSKDVDDDAAQVKRRIPEPDDDCPVCYDTMDTTKLDKLVFCVSCGNGLHQECFQQWALKSNPLTCVYCRSRWPTSTGKDSGGATVAEGYLNLASIAGVSHERDTSSYYHGPRRGQRFYAYDPY